MKHFSRRDLLRATGLSLLGTSVTPWAPALADRLAADPARRRHCVLLWMTGGPSQTDTFDMKPGHANGGEFQEIATNVPGLRFSEHLPQLAQMADRLAIIRGLSTKEGDHGRGTYLMRTGHQPAGPLRYPTIGASLSKELADKVNGIPSFVSISPYRAFNQSAFGPGFLGPRHAPLTVGATDSFQAETNGDGYARLQVDDLQSGVDAARFDKRLQLWDSLQRRFIASRKSDATIAQDTVYRRAVELMNSDAAGAFDLSTEPDAVRDAYGRGRFGQGCLMARRLIEQGVAFVEVSLGSLSGNSFAWDTHQDNFANVRSLSAELDAGWSMLMKELGERGLLASTTILWMGEFGRTPRINDSAGRDHFPAAWTAVLAGGGIAGGQAYRKTSEDGTEVVDGKVDVGDLLATFCQAAGVAPDTQNISDLGRPIRIAEGTPIGAVL